MLLCKLSSDSVVLDQHSNGPRHASLCKTALSLPSIGVEMHGQEFQDGMWLSSPEMDHMAPVEGRHLNCHMFSWVQSFNSGKETAQAAVHEWYHYTPKEWFCEAMWKLPRRWQPCMT